MNGRGDWMQTFSGRTYYPAAPRAEDVNIVDIAHALSHICRYAGHCNKFYSVAEHSYHMSFMVPVEHAMQALLHDASEAYCQDIPRPLKISLPDYRSIERLNRGAICDHFDLDPREPREVKQADNDILLSEQQALFSPAVKPWMIAGAVLRPGIKIVGHLPKKMKTLFLQRYFDLRTEA